MKSNTIIMFISSIFLIQIVVTILFSILAAIYDVMEGIVPIRLCYFLLVFGLVSNLILSLITNNIKFILASLISMVITNYVVYMLWKLKMWGGGDVRLFSAIATAIPLGVNIDFLNIFPQLSIYPFAFSVMINSILVSFPFLVVFLIHLIIKNNVFNSQKDLMISVLNINNVRKIIELTFNKTIPVKDLKEGNIVNNYYFNDEKIIDLINDADGNLRIYENHEDDEFRYYFKSLSAGGITEKEMYLLKIMSAQKFISDEISVKVSFPFTPAILIGLMIAVFYGDLMFLFTKNLVLVI